MYPCGSPYLRLVSVDDPLTTVTVCLQLFIHEVNKFEYVYGQPCIHV